MGSLRDLRDRIGSVKSTRKITSAMKMVAASKLKKAQNQAEASQPYADSMSDMIGRVASNVISSDSVPPLLSGTGRDDVHLFIIVTSDRGLCGGFNSNLVRKAQKQMEHLEAEGKTVKVICAGRKGHDILKRVMQDKILERFVNLSSGNKIAYSEADSIARFVLDAFDAGEFDVCTVVYNEFQSVLVQKPVFQKLIPFELPENDNDETKAAAGPVSPYEYEPDEETILGKLLPKNIGVQIFRALLDSAAGEQAARMTAMDNATRNAGEMIDDLTLQYNRERQATITNELIEIISGAEAL